MSTRMWKVLASTLAAAASLPAASHIAMAGFADVVEQNLPSVVRVTTARLYSRWAGEQLPTSSPATANPGKGSRPRTVTGDGSGVVVSGDGYLLTNYHVVENAARITVQFQDDRELTAQLVAFDAPTDLAVLKVDAQGLHPVSFGDSSRVRIGEPVLAIGNPFGVGTTVTAGIVSAKNSTVGDEDYIQTDAAINPGNSGGPLLNSNGELIGINTAIVSISGGSHGVGFALPSNIVRSIFSQLIVDGQVRRGYLGIGMQPLSPNLAEALAITGSGGAIITGVAPGSPAAEAGLLKGDTVIALNGRPLRDMRRLQLSIAQAQPGSVVELTTSRDGAIHNVAVKLVDRPAGPVAEQQQPVADVVLSGAALSELTSQLRAELRLSDDSAGVLVAAVDPQGESAEAGLRPGDLILAANRQPVTDLGSLQRILAGGSGKMTLLEVSRAGSTLFVAVPKL